MKMLPVKAELFQADGQTDRHDKPNSCFSQFCEGALKHTSCKTLYFYPR